MYLNTDSIVEAVGWEKTILPFCSHFAPLVAICICYIVNEHPSEGVGWSRFEWRELAGENGVFEGAAPKNFLRPRPCQFWETPFLSLEKSFETHFTYFIVHLLSFTLLWKFKSIFLLIFAYSTVYKLQFMLTQFLSMVKFPNGYLWTASECITYIFIAFITIKCSNCNILLQ